MGPDVQETFGLVTLESQACGTPVIGIRGSYMDRIIPFQPSALGIGKYTFIASLRYQCHLLGRSPESRTPCEPSSAPQVFVEDSVRPAFCALSGSYLFLFGMICGVTKTTDPTCPNPSMPFPVLRQSPAGEITFDKRHIPSARRYRGDFASDQHRYSGPR